MTSANDPVGPDPLEDPGRPSSSGSEDLDEDALDVDPLEEGMDPPEHWTSVTETGRDDLAEGGTLDERLAEETPDVDAGSVGPTEEPPD